MRTARAKGISNRKVQTFVALPVNQIGVVLSQDKMAIIDAADFHKIDGYIFHAKSLSNIAYAVTQKNGAINIKMHNLIMSPPPGMFVDHINWDGLDNRRSNLRICTASENMRNRRIFMGSSKYRGVYSAKASWVASINVGSTRYYLGTFKDERVAAFSYNMAAKHLFGVFAQPNDIGDLDVTTENALRAIEINRKRGFIV